MYYPASYGKALVYLKFHVAQIRKNVMMHLSTNGILSRMYVKIVEQVKVFDLAWDYKYKYAYYRYR